MVTLYLVGCFASFIMGYYSYMNEQNELTLIDFLVILFLSLFSWIGFLSFLSGFIIMYINKNSKTIVYRKKK